MMDQDAHLGRKAIELGFLRQEQVDQAIALLEAEVRAGQPRRFLGKILVEQGAISLDQMLSLLRTGDGDAAPAPPLAGPGGSVETTHVMDPARGAVAAGAGSTLPPSPAGASEDFSAATVVMGTGMTPAAPDDAAGAPTLLSGGPVLPPPPAAVPPPPPRVPSRPTPARMTTPPVPTADAAAEFKNAATILDLNIGDIARAATAHTDVMSEATLVDLPPTGARSGVPAPAPSLPPPPPAAGEPSALEETHISEVPLPPVGGHSAPARSNDASADTTISASPLPRKTATRSMPSPVRSEDAVAGTSVSGATPPPAPVKKSATRVIAAPVAASTPDTSGPQNTSPDAATIIHFGAEPVAIHRSAVSLPLSTPAATDLERSSVSLPQPRADVSVNDATVAPGVGGGRDATDATVASPGAAGASRDANAGTLASPGAARPAGAGPGTQNDATAAGAVQRSMVSGGTGRRPATGSHTIPPGQATFGRYQLVKELARGAMGIVYIAMDPMIRRKVALKVMIGGDTPTGELSKRFKREAMLAAKVRHPNIVQVYDVGEFDGKLYYTMELIDGDSLQGVLKKMGRIPPRMALKICRDTARALHSAHQANLVHRDIKPANIMLTGREKHRGEVESPEDTMIQIGDAKTSSFRTLVADFGIAKDVTSQTMMTRAGAVVGTPAYMSPEQAGEPDKIGPRSDLYSLGVVLYHILCGSTPFTDPDPIRLLAQVIANDPPPLRSKAPELHPDLETIVMKAIEKDPNRRYADCGAFADDMDRYLSGEMIRATPASVLYRGRRWLVRHKGIFVPLVAALLVSAGAFAYFTLWPQIQDYYREQAAAQARHARENDAQARVLRAFQKIEQREFDAAIEELQESISRYAEYARRAENVAMPEAHDLLARCYKEKGDSTQSLLENFRAYRSAIGNAGSDRYLLRTVHELVSQLRYDEATSLLNRVVRQTKDEGVRAEAWYWMGRAAEGVMDFRDAMDHFSRALVGTGLPEELQDNCKEHRTFCASLALEAPLPLPVTDLTAADIDNSSHKTLVGIGGNQVRFDTQREGGMSVRNRLEANQVYCGVVTREGFEQRGSVQLDCGDKFGLSALAVLPLPDAQHPTIVVAGGDTASRTGRLFLVRWEKTGLRAIASTPLESPAGGFAVGDLDGDGKPELFVGTGANERALRVYAWDEDNARLAFRFKVPVGGDVSRVETLDLNGDRQQEILVFAGPWQTYGTTLFQWDGAKEELVPAYSTPLGLPMSTTRIDREGKLPLFVSGVGWDRQMVYPLMRIHGEQAFQEKYRPTGAYVLEMLPDLTTRRKSLVSLDWNLARQGRAGVVRMRGRAGDFLWCNVSYQGPYDPAPPRGLGGAIHVFKTDDDLAPFTTLLPRSGASMRIGGPMWAVDLDQDGVDELVVASDRSLVYYDAWDRPDDLARLQSSARDGVTGPAPETWIGNNPLIDFGTDAERVGLRDEALSAYTEAAQTARRPEEVEQATLGQMRCYLAMDKISDLVAVAKETSSRFPSLEIPVLSEGVRLLDRGYHWSEAHRLSLRLLQSVDLTNEARERLGKASETFRELFEMVQRTRIIGPDAVPVDWLITSPVAVVPGPQSSWRIYSASDSQDRFLVPFSNAAESMRLHGQIEVLRHEYGVGLRLGVGSFDALSARSLAPLFPSLSLMARGNKNYPLFTFDLESPHPASPRIERLGERGEMWSRPLTLDLTLVAHQGNLVGRVVGLSKAESVDQRELESLVPRSDTVLAGLELASGAGSGYWGVFQINELELHSASDRVLPAGYGPVSAIDHLMLANGRWVQNRLEEARPLYDRAIRLADREHAKEDDVRADGLPSVWDRNSPNEVVSWVHVDSRFYRGLLRHTMGDAKGGQEDLDAAWELSKRRVRELLRRYAEPLHFRNKDMDALRTFWRRKAGNPEPEKVPAWARQTYEVMGAEATEMLIEGVEVDLVSHPEIRAVGLDSPADQAGLQIGDSIHKVDGVPVANEKELKEAILAAMKDKRETAQLEVQRAGQLIQVSVRARDLGIEVQSVQMREIRIR